MNPALCRLLFLVWTGIAQTHPTTQAAPAPNVAVARVIACNDTDELLIEIDGRQHAARMRSVIPLKRWPASNDPLIAKQKDEARDLLTRWIKDQTVIVDGVIADGDVIAVDVYRYSFGPSRGSGVDWSGNTPSQRFKWGGVNLNALFVERGFSPYGGNDRGRAENEMNHFETAQNAARDAHQGIWSIPSLAEKLQEEVHGNGK